MYPDCEQRSRRAVDDGCDGLQVEENGTVGRERREATTRNPREVVGQDRDAEIPRVESGEIVRRDLRFDAPDGGSRRWRTDRLSLAPVDFGIAREPIESRACDRVIAAEDLEDRFGPNPVELVACGRVAVRINQEVDAVVRGRITEHPAAGRREEVERAVIQATRVMV